MWGTDEPTMLLINEYDEIIADAREDGPSRLGLIEDIAHQSVPQRGLTRRRLGTTEP